MILDIGCREGGVLPKDWYTGVRGEGGLVENVKKMTPPFFEAKITNLLVVFQFLAKKSVWGPDSMGCVWGGVGGVLMQSMHFLIILGVLAVLGTSVSLWYPRGGVSVGMS